MYHFGPGANRSQDKDKSARGLLGITVCGDKRGRKEELAGKAFRRKCRAHKVWANQTGSSQARRLWHSAQGRNGQSQHSNHAYSLAGCCCVSETLDLTMKQTLQRAVRLQHSSQINSRCLLEGNSKWYTVLICHEQEMISLELDTALVPGIRVKECVTY